MKAVRVGMIGAGAIAEQHISGIQRHPQAEVVAIADPSKTRREALARRMGVEHTHASAEQLLDNPRVNAVCIAVPNAMHADIAMSALRAGKHVLLEKPFATSLHEAQMVAEMVRRSGKVFMVGMNQRYTPEARAVRQAIRSGQLGDIYHAKTFWMRRSGIPKFGTWFCRKDMAGGGAMLDIGVHMLDLCLYLLGNFNVQRVSAATYSRLGPRGLGEGEWGLSDPQKHQFDVDDFATAMLRLSGGVTVAVDVSWALHQQQVENRDVNLFGEQGGASVYPPRIILRAPCGGHTTEEPRLPALRDTPCRFMNWVDVILGQAELECTLEQALHVQTVIDAIYRSASSGREVSLVPDRPVHFTCGALSLESSQWPGPSPAPVVQ